MSHCEGSVLIVGAGPTGLTLACDLARRNVHFRLVDKAPAYPVGSRGKGLQPRSLEVFDDLGIVERILSHGRFHLPFRSYDGTTILGDRDLHEGRHPTPDVPYASSLMIPQWRVEETLRQNLEAAGKRVEFATELVRIGQDEDGVTATLQKEDAEEHVRCSYLAGCGKTFIFAENGHQNFAGMRMCRYQIGFEWLSGRVPRAICPLGMPEGTPLLCFMRHQPGWPTGSASGPDCKPQRRR